MEGIKQVEDYLTTNFTLFLHFSADTVRRNSVRPTKQATQIEGYTKCTVMKPHSGSHLEDQD
jgi:hypothetical protein